MKKLVLVLGILFFNGPFLFSQEIEVVTGLSHPLGIAITGSDLFICEHGGNGGAGSGFISKADLSVDNPTKENLISGLTYPRAICIVGDALFFADSYLYKFNIHEANPTETQVLYAYSPKALIASGDELFISGDDRISKINVNDENPVLNTVIDTIEDRVLAFALKGDELYFGYSNKVARINITDENPVLEEVITGLESNVYSLAFYDNTLLIGMSLLYKIVKVDLNADILVVENFINMTSIRQPGNLLVRNDELYVAGGRGNLVFKIENLSELLSTEYSSPFITKRVYPNPTNDFIYISGLVEITPYEVFNSNGSVVLNGIMQPNEYLDFSNLSSGLYFVKLKNESQKETQLKVVKK